MFKMYKRASLALPLSLIFLALSFNVQALDKLETKIDKTIRDACYGFVVEMLPEALRGIIYKNSSTCKSVKAHKGDVAGALKVIGQSDLRDPRRWVPRRSNVSIDIDCHTDLMCTKIRGRHKTGEIPVSQFDYNEVKAHCKYKDETTEYVCVEKWFKIWPQALPVERYEKAPSLSVASGPVGKKTRIYTAVVENNFQYNKHESDRESANFTTGTVKLSITNKTRQPLSFGKVTVLHKCVVPSATIKAMGRTKYNSFYHEYYLSNKNKIVAGGNGTVTQIFSYPEKESARKGPCGGSHGGVASSEMIDVQFSQKDMISYNQFMKCGDIRVPVVWELRPESNTFFVYTEKQILKFNTEQLPPADIANTSVQNNAQRIETQLPSITGKDDGKYFVIKGKKLSLFEHVCKNRPSDPASVQRWKALFLHKMRQWGSACKNQPERCKKAYQKKYPAAATGPRG